MYKKNVIVLNGGCLDSGSCSKRSKRFAFKSKYMADGGKPFESLSKRIVRRSPIEAGNQGNDMQSLFKEDPKGRIEDRRVKVLYNNNYGDINGKL